MAENSVVVRVPNGHRQTLKISPNTTILQILEDVCQKHGFNANKFNLKHRNNILDPNAIFRFTGLVNNAQLEMVPCTERSISNVTIGVQLENGTRSTGEFASDTTLLGVLLSLCPGQDPEKSALIYLHRMVHGTDELEKTTLQSLGLNSGRAMLRLKIQASDQTQTQAHVTVPLTKTSKKSGGGSGKHQKNNRNKSASTFIQNPVPNVMSMLKSEKTQKAQQKVEPPQSECKNNREVKPAAAETDHKDTLITTDQPVSEPSTSSDKNKVEAKAEEESDQNQEDANPAQVEFTGDRNALIFNQANVKAVPRDELPENFYELTIDDAKVLLRDAKRRRQEIEDAPFLTAAQRQLTKEQKKLEQLHKYRRAVIRIQFPDQLVLQGIFGPLEKVQAVKDFIKDYLCDPESDFTIYTAPPKHILNTEAHLVDENLVPSSIVYYSGPSSLKQDIRAKLSVSEHAALDPLRKRKGITRGQTETHSNESDASNRNTAGTLNKISNIIPKWFSQSFKK